MAGPTLRFKNTNPHPHFLVALDANHPSSVPFPETSIAVAPHLASLLPQQARRGGRQQQTQKERGAGGTEPPAGLLTAAHADRTSEGGRDCSHVTPIQLIFLKGGATTPVLKTTASLNPYLGFSENTSRLVHHPQGGWQASHPGLDADLLPTAPAQLVSLNSYL